MANLRKIYWDTSCFICFLNRTEIERRKICEDILRHAQRNELLIFTSTFTIAEVVKPKNKSIPGARRLTSSEISKIEGMFRWRWLRKLDLEQRIAFRAVELSRDCGLLPGDAIHASTAVCWKLDVIQRWDRDFDSVRHLIESEDPQMLTKQQDLAIAELPRIGPHPDDFDEPLSIGQ